ncbi:arginyltransferase [Altererythrobacter indicus]|uniref:Aspartate/glutamate leucyltransferase n=1 Tax=Altericroceibacterium indicum TaxID=374177 RepID=A0A845A5T3_9SPHN|nr:arginyltransferase [Altericroceibacterium indicum]
MTAPTSFPRFFVTSSAPCPYLANRVERKVFTELKGPHAEQLNEALGRIGFRRSQMVAYRPSCQNCQACISVRVVAGEFRPSSTQRRDFRRNSDLIVSECRPWATSEQFELLRNYLSKRHPDGGMAAMDEMDFADMVEHTPVSTCVTEYREPDGLGGAGRLVGACLTDRQSDGLSMIYSFYDPELQDRKGLGNYIILDHIHRAAADGLDYVYLGYWVEGSRQMQYKIRYRPLEKLGGEGWQRFGEEEQSELIATALSSNQDKAPAISGGSKDGTPGGQSQYKIS